mgnify:CR=1 FL=1
MKIFNRLLALLMILSVFISGIRVNAMSMSTSKEAYRLEALGFLDAADIDESLTQMSKALFVKTAVRMYLALNVPSRYSEIDFKDVNPGDFAADEIQFALKSGLVEKTESFYPNSAISYDEAIKIIVRVLGYEPAAEKEGYNAAAVKAKVLGGVNSKFELKDALRLLDNALESPLMRQLSYGSSVEYSVEKERTLLTEAGIIIKSVYITNVDVHDGTIEADGTEYSTENVNLDSIPEGRAKIYVRNSDDTVIYIDVLGDTEVFYDFIEYVNGEQRSADIYPSAIRKLSLRNIGKTYAVETDAKITLNDSTISGSYVNTFAKIIVKQNKIVKAEAYTLRVGGLIYRADKQQIKYITGECPENTIIGFDKVDDLQVYVDGVKSSDMLKLKAEMVFDYWCSDDESKFIIVASSRNAAGKFDSHASGSIRVDGVKYEISAANKPVAQSYISKKYTDTEDYKKFLSQNVKIYIDDNKYVRFIKIDESLTEINEFYGVVLGVKKPNGLDGEYEVKVYKITGGMGEEIYKVSSKLSSDSLGMDYVASVAKNYDGHGFLKFGLNGKNEIRKVEVPEYWGATTTTTQISEGWNNRIGGVPINKATMFALYNDNGEFTVHQFAWDSLKATQTRNQVPMTVVSDFDIRYNPVPRFIALTQNCTKLCSDYTTFDVLLDRYNNMDDKVSLEFAGGSSYSVTPEFVEENNLTGRCLVRFQRNIFGDAPFFLNPQNDVYDLTGEPEEWKTNEYTQDKWNGFFKADSVRYRDESVVQFNIAGEPSEVYFIESPRVYEYNRHRDMFIKRSFENIPSGCPVWYYAAEWPSPKGVHILIYETDSMVPQIDA